MTDEQVYAALRALAEEHGWSCDLEYTSTGDIKSLKMKRPAKREWAYVEGDDLACFGSLSEDCEYWMSLPKPPEL